MSQKLAPEIVTGLNLYKKASGFNELGLTSEILKAVKLQGFDTPTEIQFKAIPAVLAGQDVLASAQTGSGKTAAFCLPLLQQWWQSQQLLSRGQRHGKRQTGVLILVPTRELAAQTGEVMRSLAQHLPAKLKIAILFGGVSINPQMMNLRGGADVVVATPGRLLDVVKHNALKLGEVNTLVLDEADRLLDMGFADELKGVLALLPAQRQNLFFSATFPPEVQSLADTLLQNAVRIEVATRTETAPIILQRAIQVDPKRRTQLLRHMVEESDWDQVLVFVATKYAAELVATKLYNAGMNAVPFHGELSQGNRMQTLVDFKAKKWQVVIATDVAARGIDIPNLDAVVNYDLPRSSVDYIHRIGRTGRAGQSGVAISFISPETEAHFRLIEKRQGLNLIREQVAGYEPEIVLAPPKPNVKSEPVTIEGVDEKSPNHPKNGGIKGKRPSKKDKLRALAAKGHGQG
ncbi:MAG TPA: DEAD/DEAH box helicase [Burkholderiaceae bacterium]|nr:DEAD/DEAH box helicase [Burkholderiaceae bacterium]